MTKMLVVLLALVLALPAVAADQLVVKLGKSANKARAAKATDLTADALKAASTAKGKTKFSVTGADGAKFALELSAKDASDILGGTTVTTAIAGGPKVWISLVKEQPKVEKREEHAAPPPAPASSGW